MYPVFISRLDADIFLFRTKISNLPEDVKEIDLARSLLRLKHSRSISIDRSATPVYAYLSGQRSEKEARNRIYKWHKTRYEDQPIECQLELYNRNTRIPQEEDQTLIASNNDYPRDTSNYVNDGDDDDTESLAESEVSVRSTNCSTSE